MYKYCIVPKCKNTSFKTPEKLFFNVPKDPKLRKTWYAVVKRDDKTLPSAQATRHCCEDHFDIETDMENYVKYKLVGGRIKLKNGIIPHKFKCQEMKEDEIVDTSSARKRHPKIIRKKLLIKEEPTTDDDEEEDDDDVTNEETEEFFVPSYIDEITTEDPLSLGNNDHCLTRSKRSIGVQVILQENNDQNLTISKKNKGVQCNMQKRKVFHVSTITDET